MITDVIIFSFDYVDKLADVWLVNFVSNERKNRRTSSFDNMIIDFDN